jgi:gas vesicle protein
MSRFIIGLLVGLGISLLIAPKPGKELRQLLAQSWKDMRSLPASTEPNRESAQGQGEQILSAQELAQRAAQRGTTVPESAQPPAQQASANPPPRQGGRSIKPPRMIRPTP